MSNFATIMPPAEAVSYLVNLAVAVSVVGAVGLVTVRIGRHGSAPLRHGVLVWTLVLILLSPSAVWLAGQNGLAVIRLDLSDRSDLSAAGIAKETIPHIAEPAASQPTNRFIAGERPSLGLPRDRMGMPSELEFSDRPGDTAPPVPVVASEASRSVTGESSRLLPEEPPHLAWWQGVGALAAWLWAIGTVVALLRLGRGYLALVRFCCRLTPLSDRGPETAARQAAHTVGLRKPPPLFLSCRVTVPLSIGLIKPAIVLPEAMAEESDAEQLQVVLLHEMAHIARCDQWVGLGQRLAAVLFWWNPLVYRVGFELAELREEICDDYVMLVHDGGQRLARILVDLAERTTIRPLLPLTIGILEPRRTGLAGRITRLLDKERNMETRMSLKSKVLVCLVGLALLIGMASVGGLRLAHAEPSTEAQPTIANQLTAVSSSPPADAQPSNSVAGEAKPNAQRSGDPFGRESGPASGQIQAQKPKWLDGSGKDLRIKVAGKVFDEKGTPANDYKLEARLETNFGGRGLPAAIEGNRFEFWVPAGIASWFRLDVNATSTDGRQIARKWILDDQIRQAAIDGLVLKMKKPERSVEVTVLANGQAVSDVSVAAEFEGGRVTGKTNGAGVVAFPAMNHDKLSQLTAWTNDFKIGGYSFGRDPPRDPASGKYTIELETCRSQTIRIINDEGKAPIPNLEFVLTVMTAAPNYQFPGKTPDCEMKTNENGEAVFRRFPDWKENSCYIEIPDQHWVRAADAKMVDGTLVFRLRKSRFDNRKHIIGRVTSAGGNVAGFCVSISSFQGEEKNKLDCLYAFTDEHGEFAADYLPGATYDICINDVRFVSSIIDLIPYEPTTGKTNAPSLNVSPGQPVEIVVTAGPAKRPVAHQFINLETPHSYSCRVDGQTQNFVGGRRWQVTTDEQGKACTFALPGKEIKGSLYTPEWQSEESVQVKTDGGTRLEFHRKVAAKRKVVGRLLPADKVDADLNEAVVQLGAVDGETNEHLTIKTKPDGQFAFESQASRIGIYARTKDAKAAAVCIVERLDLPIELRLNPTGEFRGQLLGKEDSPLQGHAVRASLSVGKHDYSKPGPTSFYVATFEAKTDSEGRYTLTGVPYEAALSLRTDSIDGSGQDNCLGEFYLVPNESRPLDVSRLWQKPATKTSFAERYAKVLRDCRLSHFHAMVILFRPSDDTKRFVDVNLMDYQTTKEVSYFMQLQGQIGDDSATAEIAEFGRSKNWPTPEKGRVFACAIDAAGKELGRIEFDSKDPDGPKLAAQFIRKHAPTPADAKKKWDEAFAVAKQSNRKVWVRICQRYCGPCFMLTRWLDDHKDALEQDYVLLKIDDWGDLHGEEVAQRLTGSEGAGVPFHAIFDSNARMLINSVSPIGNIGYPSGFEGKKHVRKMLTETRNNLPVKQIDEIVGSLND